MLYTETPTYVSESSSVLINVFLFVLSLEWILITKHYSIFFHSLNSIFVDLTQNYYTKKKTVL